MSSTTTIAIGADHAGFEYKEMLKEMLAGSAYEIKDFGTYAAASVDYPDFAHPVAEAVESNVADFGILVCGSANGVAITANKHQQIRAAICWENDIAALARQHNNANVICIPARFVSEDLAKEMVQTFLNTAFEGGRHGDRVDKIAC
jgi:ribose 5-phosphate isomerase B